MKISFKNELDLNKRVYECFICGKIFNWDKNSRWYGSDKQMEEHPDKIPYFCSYTCFSKYPIKKQKHKDKEQ
jgi:hypothetical protein